MTTELAFDTGKILLAVAAAGFTYFKFFREGTHRQRIEFDIDLCDLGYAAGERIVEVGITAENKGNVEQRFRDIRLRIRGILVGAQLSEIKGHEPHLAFPEKLHEASLIPERMGYFFVRPKVRQRFPLVVRVPVACSHILVRSTFKYDGSNDLHTAERAFSLTDTQRAEQDGADQPATASESKPEGGDKPKPEPEARPQ
jgi:hypothetical protein